MTSIIKHSRKTQLFSNNQSWEKKSDDQDFDVLMGCYDRADFCELVGIYILNKLSNILIKAVLDYTVMINLEYLKIYLEHKSSGKRNASLNCLKSVV